MSLSIVERRIDQIVVVDVMGQMTLECQTHRLSDYIRRGLGEGCRGFLIHLRHVSDCDTAGLTALVVSLTHIKTKDGALGLVAVQPRVQRIIEVAGLWQTFQTFGDIPAAVTWVRRCLTEGEQQES